MIRGIVTYAVLCLALWPVAGFADQTERDELYVQSKFDMLESGDHRDASMAVDTLAKFNYYPLRMIKQSVARIQAICEPISRFPDDKNAFLVMEKEYNFRALGYHAQLISKIIRRTKTHADEVAVLMSADNYCQKISAMDIARKIRGLAKPLRGDIEKIMQIRDTPDYIQPDFPTMGAKVLEAIEESS